jgi:hypothetical protein
MRARHACKIEEGKHKTVEDRQHAGSIPLANLAVIYYWGDKFAVTAGLCLQFYLHFYGSWTHSVCLLARSKDVR